MINNFHVSVISHLDKYFTKNEKLFSFNDDSSNSCNDTNQTSNVSSQQPNQVTSPADSFCVYCLNKLNPFQIDFDLSIRLCSNSECSRYKSGDINSFGIESINNSYSKLTNNDEQLVDSSSLETIFDEFTSVTRKIVQNGLQRYESNRNDSTSIISNKNGETSSLNQYQELYESNFDLTNFNDNSVVPVPLPGDLDNTDSLPAAINQTNFNNLTLPVQSNFINPSNINLQPQQSVLFDDNFFSDIDSLLTEDYNTNTAVPSGNSNFNTNQDQIDWTSFGNSLENSNNNNVNLDSNDFGFNNIEEPASCFELKTTSSSKLAAQLTSNLYENEFLDPVTLSNSNESLKFQIKEPNVDIIADSKTKSGTSGILITKQRKPTVRNEFNLTSTNKKNSNQLEVSISSTKLKIVEEKDELLELLTKPNQETQPKAVNIQPTKTYIEEFKPANARTNENNDKLLPWEIKSKDYKSKFLRYI